MSGIATRAQVIQLIQDFSKRPISAREAIVFINSKTTTWEDLLEICKELVNQRAAIEDLIGVSNRGRLRQVINAIAPQYTPDYNKIGKGATMLPIPWDDLNIYQGAKESDVRAAMQRLFEALPTKAPAKPKPTAKRTTLDIEDEDDEDKPPPKSYPKATARAAKVAGQASVIDMALGRAVAPKYGQASKNYIDIANAGTTVLGDLYKPHDTNRTPSRLDRTQRYTRDDTDKEYFFRDRLFNPAVSDGDIRCKRSYTYKDTSGTEIKDALAIVVEKQAESDSFKIARVEISQDALRDAEDASILIRNAVESIAAMARTVMAKTGKPKVIAIGESNPERAIEMAVWVLGMGLPVKFKPATQSIVDAAIQGYAPGSVHHRRAMLIRENQALRAAGNLESAFMKVITHLKTVEKNQEPITALEDRARITAHCAHAQRGLRLKV